MKLTTHVLAIIGLWAITVQTELNAKTILIPIDSIFSSITRISDIKVIGYTGDSVMTYMDLKKQDTLQLNCKWKIISELTIKQIKENDSDYSSWEGSFPEVGEIVTMLNYSYAGDRILFGRKNNDTYRFWDPKSVPFANSAFFAAKDGIYKPTEFCQNDDPGETGFYCSDGFLIEEKEMERILK